MVVPVANEAEAISISAGASLGGRPAAVYMEGSGVYVGSFNLLCLGKAPRGSDAADRRLLRKCPGRAQ